jgi:hypothetical protein
LALNSAEYRVRLPVIGSVLLRPNRAYRTVRIPGTISEQLIDGLGRMGAEFLTLEQVQQEFRDRQPV